VTDVAEYQAALLDVGVGVEIPSDPKGLEAKLCRLAVESAHKAPPDVALAIAHGSFTDGKRRLLVLPPDDAFLAKVSEWCHWAWRHHHGTPVGMALSAVTYGLALGSTPVQQHYTPSGKKTKNCYSKHVGKIGYAPIHWFEIRVPKPEGHGLPGPCFLRLLRCEACGDVVNVWVLRGESHDVACEDRPPKKAETMPSRIMVPNKKGKPVGWLAFDAWRPGERSGGYTCVGNLRWES